MGFRSWIVQFRSVSVLQILFCPGKKHFFSKISDFLQIKEDLLNLTEEFYVPMAKQLIPCLPALMASLVLMLEENDEVIKKRVNKQIDQIREVSSFQKY